MVEAAALGTAAQVVTAAPMDRVVAKSSGLGQEERAGSSLPALLLAAPNPLNQAACANALTLPRSARSFPAATAPCPRKL